MTRYDTYMNKGIHSRKLAAVLAAFFLLSAGPAMAQSTTYSDHPSLKRNPNQGYRASKSRVTPKQTTSTTATGLLNQTRVGASQQTQDPKEPQQPQPTYRYDTYNGYHVPVYPGPDAPLPDSGGYYNPYYDGYYNNGYYNNGYYNNSYTTNTQTQTRSGSGFPPFERY
jgi:hypothetical protein